MTGSTKMNKFMRDGKTPRCLEEVCTYNGIWPHYGQCERSAKVDTRCRQHDPEAVAKRDEEREARNKARWRKQMLEVHGHRFYAVLETIAKGHNNARTLAKETIDKFDERH